MNLGGITSKLTSSIPKLASIGGFVLSSPTWTGNGLNELMSSLENLLSGQVHIPDFTAITDYAKSPEAKQLLFAYVGGMIAGELNIAGTGKYGKVLTKGAENYAMAAIAKRILYLSTHANEGSDPTIASGSSIRTNFLNAPAIQEYDY